MCIYIYIYIYIHTHKSPRLAPWQHPGGYGAPLPSNEARPYSVL